MLRFAMSLRYVMLVASFGAALGALVLFWEGTAHMIGAVRHILADAEAKVVIAEVMGGTDVYLFGIVLIIFAYAIAFGFVFDMSAEQRARLPVWMRPAGMTELKTTLVAAILVYLIVDFATDWSELQRPVSWLILTKPISILLIAGAFRLFVSYRNDAGSSS
jgi:uncharacterized membrane protein YqhA